MSKLTKEQVLSMTKEQIHEHAKKLKTKAVNIGCSNCDNCNDCYDCNNCKNCNDCTYCKNCYDCTDCTDCDNCYDCNNCTDCTNCKSCNDCYDCYDCKSLLSKQYCILNVQLTKDEYEAKIKEFRERLSRGFNIQNYGA